ncbi:dihydropteroate synthase [Polymorphobacter fuscus]|uniref:Dihydropteroate synthase n=1 Tax=Sandarakinorhabdus fusca TaxID=1439888 RepID=A0A7C9KWZ3_9SPHN|nr:dihydropteroate synthase [Polymorphobacter fuscus]KAB7648881.1 dihydropteroate synthase [Polymorphobacter fuscus]MQT16466.1 dihydropteroate synthase [Polymorphobacter fuscus]NJC07244.1 dihydropteroate synthase [Polymorphobacter fuscus]
MDHYRPIALGDGVLLAGGPLRFARAEVLARGRAPRTVAAKDIPEPVLARLTRPRPALPGVPAGRTGVMGILNVTPDSFSDGGRHAAAPAAAARAMAAAGADIIDVGAESTRPGAAAVDTETEAARLATVLPGLAGLTWSIDTRKAAIMGRALDAGAALVNDVSALGHDPAAPALVAARGCPVVLMHAQGTPETMQAAPAYDDALLDVYDWLAMRIDACVAAGIDRSRIIADPGIGFGKTLEHNLAVLRGLTLFHGLGVPLLLGASRKALIGRMAGNAPPDARLPGSLALALHGAACGVQMVRVHDVAETVQALAVWRSATLADALG